MPAGVKAPPFKGAKDGQDARSLPHTPGSGIAGNGKPSLILHHPTKAWPRTLPPMVAGPRPHQTNRGNLN